MIGAIVLFQIAFSAPAAPMRPAVPAVPTDLSTAASQIRINRKALEGWVPKKGTPAPVAPLPDIVLVPTAEETPRRAEPAYEEEAPGDESVNSFVGPRPWFFAPWPQPHPRVVHRGRHGAVARGPSGAFPRAPGRPGHWPARRLR